MSGFLSVRVGRITTVPDGLTLVETAWVEVLLVLTTEVGVELRGKLGRRPMIGREVAVLRFDGVPALVLALNGLLLGLVAT